MSDNPAPLPDQAAPSSPVASFDVAGHRLALSAGTIATIGGGALLVIFMAQNTDEVNLQFLFWDFDWPLWLVVLLSATVGALVWLGLGILRRHRRRVERREARRD
jgi:uncharacterized integral membrane protein